MKSTPKILDSTQPILYETGYEEDSYSYAGSCFPVRWKNKLYIISAYHCYENFDVKPENTLYKIPFSQNEYFAFSSKLRAKADFHNDLKHYDHVALEVCDKTHNINQTSSVLALDLSDENSIKPFYSNEISDVWLRGYLFDCPNHIIDNSLKKIQQQAYVTNGLVSKRESNFDYCFNLRVITPTPDKFSPSGMSGSPVYCEDSNRNIYLSGIVIEFNPHTEEYIVIDSSVLRELLCKENN